MTDLQFALRSMRKAPGFVVVAIATLAHGIGANTAIFSVVNTFLLRPLPFGNADRLVALFERNVINNEPAMSPSPGNFLDWQRSATSFAQISAMITPMVTMAGSGPGATAERVFICSCSGNLFDTLGAAP